MISKFYRLSALITAFLSMSPAKAQIKAYATADDYSHNKYMEVEDIRIKNRKTGNEGSYHIFTRDYKLNKKLQNGCWAMQGMIPCS